MNSLSLKKNRKTNHQNQNKIYVRLDYLKHYYLVLCTKHRITQSYISFSFANSGSFRFATCHACLMMYFRPVTGSIWWWNMGVSLWTSIINFINLWIHSFQIQLPYNATSSYKIKLEKTEVGDDISV